jgi:hypothetical protein
MLARVRVVQLIVDDSQSTKCQHNRNTNLAASPQLETA